MTKTSFTNKGINKLLFEKRKKLNLSLKEASKKLHISKLFLHLIENGYIAVSKKNQKKFITCYNLSPDFFDNDLGYPVMISEEETKVASAFIRKLTRNKFYIIACATLTLGFLATAISGVTLNINSKNNPTSFYDNTALTVRNYIIDHPDDVTYLDFNKRYTINNDARIRDELKVSTTVYEAEQKIKDTYCESSYREFGFVPLKDKKIHLINFDYKIQYLFGIPYYTSDIKVDTERFGRVTATLKDNNFNYHLIKMVNEKGIEIPIENDDPRRQDFVEMFERNIDKIHSGLTDLFNQKTDLGVSYVDFNNSMIKGCTNLVNNDVRNALLLLFGIIFSCLFLSLTVLAFFKRDPYVEEANDEPEKPVAINENKKPEIKEKRQVSVSLPLNPRFSPFIPGAVLRVASTLMIFVYSIGIYLVFANFINTDFTKSLDVLIGCKIFVSFLIIAYIILLFVKIDMVQERKDYFLTNYFYFFCGIALYLLVIAIDAISINDSTIKGTVSNVILELIPGNFLWGFLAFNMIVYLLFYKPISYGNDKKKLLHFRLLAILPYSYLVISMILGICDSCLKLKMPTWLSFLFFTKSTDIIIFAIVFTLFCFFYKKRTIKKYGNENAVLYQKGNRYYFVKNIAGSLIVALIGIVEILCLLFCPNNPLGFGKDTLILIAIPFMLFYHPHHGKRSGKIDWSITIFYGLSYVIGIVLILLSLISLVVRYL